jgi:TPP-dependent pyruvate/acetoin dehydrogenase alpha subunit
MTADVEAKMRHEILDEITDALQYAERQAPKPPLRSMFEDVYSDMPWHLREQAAELEAEIAKHGPKSGHG